jgi:hypothetical protein
MRAPRASIEMTGARRPSYRDRPDLYSSSRTAQGQSEVLPSLRYSRRVPPPEEVALRPVPFLDFGMQEGATPVVVELSAADFDRR